MTESEVVRQSVKALTEKRELIAGRVHSIGYQFAQLGDNGAVVPPPTVEDIAMRVIEANAVVRTYDDAIAIITETFRQMSAPDKGTSKTVVKPKRGAPYQ